MAPTGTPFHRTDPASRSVRPKIARIVVVLPAPFGPRNPTTCPEGTEKLRLSRAVTVPKRRLRPSSSNRPATSAPSDPPCWFPGSSDLVVQRLVAHGGHWGLLPHPLSSMIQQPDLPHWRLAQRAGRWCIDQEAHPSGDLVATLTVPGPGRRAVAGRARALRILGGRVRGVSALAARRYLAAAADHVAGAGGCAGRICWDVSVDSTSCRAHQHAAGARKRGDLQAQPPGGVHHEPADHGLGRSRGGLTTKLHLGCEQGQRPLSIVLTAGQRGDSPQFAVVLHGIRVPRLGGGRPRTRPDQVLADKAYTSRANRRYLRRRGIKATIPSKADQDANRRKQGSRGGRPPAFDPETYKQRHAVECGINQGRRLQPAAAWPVAADRSGQH